MFFSLKQATENQHFIPKGQPIKRKFGQTFNYNAFPSNTLYQHDLNIDPTHEQTSNENALSRKELLKMARERSLDDRLKEAIYGHTGGDSEASYSSRRKLIYQRSQRDQKSARSSHKSEVASYLSQRNKFLGKSSDQKSYVSKGHVQRFNENLAESVQESKPLMGAAVRSIFSARKSPSKA